LNFLYQSWYLCSISRLFAFLFIFIFSKTCTINRTIYYECYMILYNKYYILPELIFDLSACFSIVGSMMDLAVSKCMKGHDFPDP
jgi:hypothetical protein